MVHILSHYKWYWFELEVIFCYFFQLLLLLNNFHDKDMVKTYVFEGQAPVLGQN